MINPDQRVPLEALSRAGRFIAAVRADDTKGKRAPLHEASRDGHLLEFAIACGIFAAQMADKLHGPEKAQLHLDGLALDAAWYRDREIALLDQRQHAADTTDDETD